mmetsp:Transcript_22738/g.47209  ORF Transcript_22738/g.47209 Transcript_22738/m.47209 type:complete len:149 (+) Transcript_22738:5275-5721(+)
MPIKSIYTTHSWLGLQIGALPTVGKATDEAKGVQARGCNEDTNHGMERKTLGWFEHVQPSPMIEPVDEFADGSRGWIAAQRVSVGLAEVGGRGRHCFRKRDSHIDGGGATSMNEARPREEKEIVSFAHCFAALRLCFALTWRTMDVRP